jgi:hypothetical protein
MRRRAEDGFVMVTVVVVMSLTLVIAGAALTDTIGARQGTNQDAGAKRALQAADAGVQKTLYRLNQLSLSTLNVNGGLSGLALPLGCLRQQFPVGERALNLVGVTASGTCPGGETLGPTFLNVREPLGNGTSFKAFVQMGATSYETLPSLGHVSLSPKIVSHGYDDNGTAADTADDTVVRVQATLEPIDPFMAVEATRDVTFRGLATTFNGNARANRDFKVEGLTITGGNILSGGSLVNLAGFEYGRTYSHPLLTVALPTPRKIDHTPFFTRSPVSVSPSKPDCGGSGGAGPCPSSSFYNSSNHRLTVTGTSSLTLASGDYVFCSVSVDNGATLRTASSGGPVRIYVDSPASSRCSNSSSTGNVTITGSLNPGVSLTPSRLQIYLVGNGTPGGTTVTIGRTGLPLTNAFFLYGPDSDVTVYYSVFTGTVIGRDVIMSAQQLGLSLVGVVTQDLNLANQPLANGLGVFRQKQYVECRAVEIVPPADVTTDC